MTEPQSFASQFSDVDATDSPSAWLEFLDRVAAIPGFAEAKRATTSALRLGPGDRVLDVGCGTGVDLPEMLVPTQPGGSVVGVDLSEHAVDAASGRVSDIPSISVHVADAQSLPFADRSFDAARIDRVLLHLDRPEDALAEISRVLDPGGRIGILEMAGGLEGDDVVLADPVFEAVSRMFWSTADNRRVDVFLPLLVARAGFVGGRIDVGDSTSYAFEDASALLRLEASVAEGAKHGVLSLDAGRLWLDRVRASLDQRTIRFRVAYTRYAGVKPG